MGQIKTILDRGQFIVHLPKILLLSKDPKTPAWDSGGGRGVITPYNPPSSASKCDELIPDIWFIYLFEKGDHYQTKPKYFRGWRYNQTQPKPSENIIKFVAQYSQYGSNLFSYILFVTQTLCDGADETKFVSISKDC